MGPIEQDLLQTYAAARQRLVNPPKPAVVVVVVAVDTPAVVDFPGSSIGLLTEISNAHGVHLRELLGTAQSDKIMAARREASFRLLVERGKTYPEAGRILRRDHSTIVRQVAAHIAANPALAPVYAGMVQQRRDSLEAREKAAVRMRKAGETFKAIFEETEIHSRKVHALMKREWLK